MQMHAEEYAAAESYWKDKTFPSISSEQFNEIKEHGKRLIKFHLRHPVIHHIINFGVLVLLFGLDALILLRLGKLLATGPIRTGIVVGILHGAVMYSLAVFTLHEGAAHKLIILPQGRFSRFLGGIVNNLNRITLAESDYYAKSHLSHHAHFTTPQDDEFLNFISAKRFFSSLIPFAAVFNFSDFKAHTGMTYTPSRLLSLFLTSLYHGIFVFFMALQYSWLMILVALGIVYPNVGFWFDRFRQYTEHNLMPLNPVDGARDLGLDFWGMLIGGGPWGQPCHWSHHLYPGIPWYNQLRLHQIIARILTPEQKEKFFLQPFTGFPRTFWSLIKTTGK